MSKLFAERLICGMHVMLSTWLPMHVVGARLVDLYQFAVAGWK